MEKKVFLIDIDGVVCLHAEAICKAVNRDFGLCKTEADVDKYDYDFGPITFYEAVKRYYPDRNFILKMEATEGFCNFLSFLIGKFKVKFATARKEVCHEATREWIKNRFGEFEVIFVGNKTDVDFDYLIDDYDVESASEKGKIVFLFSKPWNREKQEKLKKSLNVFCVNTFSEVIEKLGEIG